MFGTYIVAERILYVTDFNKYVQYFVADKVETMRCDSNVI